MREFGYQWRAHIDGSGFSDVLKLYIAQDIFVPGAPCRVKIWRLTDFSEIGEGDFYPEPSIQAPKRVLQPFIQAIVDEAWRHGIRPTQLALHEAENRTQLSHLNDMRAIVGKHLKVQLP